MRRNNQSGFLLLEAILVLLLTGLIMAWKISAYNKTTVSLKAVNAQASDVNAMSGQIQQLYNSAGDMNKINQIIPDLKANAENIQNIYSK